MFCRKCGTEFQDANFCPKCGQPVNGGNTPQQPAYQAPPIVINNVSTATANAVDAGPAMGSISSKSKWVAFVLCLLLGALGVHRFYVGKVGTGIIWLFTGGLMGVGWIFDLIMILCGSFTDSSRCFLKN